MWKGVLTSGGTSFLLPYHHTQPLTASFLFATSLVPGFLLPFCGKQPPFYASSLFALLWTGVSSSATFPFVFLPFLECTMLHWGIIVLDQDRTTGKLCMGSMEFDKFLFWHLQILQHFEDYMFN